MAKFRVLPPDIPMIDPATGKWTSDGYDVMKGLERIFDQLKTTDLVDVSTTAPTNTQVLIWNNTTKLWTPGAN
jgi:hypothetical protein